MRTYNIHEAKTQLSRLVEKAGKPTPEASQRKRFGFLSGQIKVPEKKLERQSQFVDFIGGASGTRTPDTRIMI